MEKTLDKVKQNHKKVDKISREQMIERLEQELKRIETAYNKNQNEGKKLEVLFYEKRGALAHIKEID